MTEHFKIELNENRLEALLHLEKKVSDPSKLMADIAETLKDSAQQRFETGIGPDGLAWAPLRSGEGRLPLLKGGSLSDQIVPSSGKDWAEVSATMPYARFHQEGTKPYTIKPKKGKALNIPGVGRRKQVNHPGLPARPFMGISDQDMREISAIVSEWLAEA